MMTQEKIYNSQLGDLGDRRKSGILWRPSNNLRETKGTVSRMAHVISIINLKGGVGKTTTAVALAEAFSAERNKRVLVIDLDPQTNATVLLIGDSRWGRLNDNERTLARLFKDAFESPDDKKFDFDAALQKNISDLRYYYQLPDLLPSSLDLIDVQDRLALMPRGQFHSGTETPINLLSRAVMPKLSAYDIVLVDCPPNLGIITLNGLLISQSYIIPTVPDVLSTYGIPQIVSRVQEFSTDTSHHVEPLGIIVTKYQSNSGVHNRIRGQLRRNRYAPDNQNVPVLETTIRQSNQIAAAAEYQRTKRTFRQKYGYGANGGANAYLQLADEVLERIEA